MCVAISETEGHLPDGTKSMCEVHKKYLKRILTDDLNFLASTVVEISDCPEDFVKLDGR